MKSKDLHITADCTDNSITLSPDLCKSLRTGQGKSVHIFVFQIKETGEFAFSRVSQTFAKQTQCGVVSYSQTLKSLGFISLVPTVNYMFYNMGIDADTHKFRVEKQTLSDNSTIYVIKNDKRA